MKLIGNKILLLLLGITFFSSCKDEELAPVLTFDSATIGAYPRLVEITSGESQYY